jgi:hypothetical protein
MRVLLDTHVLLWALAEPTMMDAQTRAVIEASDNEVLFSAASIWKIAIKAGLGRPDFAFDPADIARAALDTGLPNWRAARTRPLSSAGCRRCIVILSIASSWRRRSSNRRPSTPPTDSLCPIRTWSGTSPRTSPGGAARGTDGRTGWAGRSEAHSRW